MALDLTAAEQILDLIDQHPSLTLEELVKACPRLSWNQVFLEVDRLTRTGELRLRQRAPGSYTLHPGGRHLKMRLLHA